MKIIDKKEFIKAVLDENVKAFVVHVTSFSFNLMPIYLAQKAQIALLVAKEVKVLIKYSDFLDVFLEEKALILPKVTEMNQHTIKLPDGQQSAYRLIYSLGPVELKTLKIYIKINLTNGFI